MNCTRFVTPLVVAVFGSAWVSIAPLRGDAPILTIDSGGHTATVRKIFFTPDGRYLISAGEDKVVRVWDVATGDTVRTIRGQVGPGAEGKIYAAAMSPDGRTLAIGGRSTGSQPRGSVSLVDFQSGQVLGILPVAEGVVTSLAFSLDGSFLAAGSTDLTARVWEVATKSLIHTFQGHTKDVYSVAFSPDGRRLVSGSLDHTLRLWDLATEGLIRTMEESEAEIRAVAYSPDGRFIVSGGDDETVRLWDAESGQFVRVFAHQPTGVTTLSFSPDGHLLLTGAGVGTSADKTCFVFTFPEGKILTRFDRHENVVFSTAFSPDGRLAATVGGNNQEIFLWKVNSGEVVRRLEGRGNPVWSVGFGVDGISPRFGQTFRGESANRRGPLEQALLLNQNDSAGITIRENPQGVTVQSRETIGDLRLRLASGPASENDPVLQLLRGEEVLLNFVRDGTTGWEHRCFTFTPDGRSIVSGGGNGDLRIYDATTGGLTRQLIGHTGDIWAVAVSADGRFVASGSHDQTLRLWDFASGKNLLTVFPASDGEWVAWTPEGYYASSLHGDRYIGWQVNQGPNHAALYYPATQFQSQYYRPDAVAEYVQTGDIQVALARANARRGSIASPVSSIESILPPLVHVFSPKESQVVAQGVLRVQAAALSVNLPITDLRVLVNGVQVAGTLEGQANGDLRDREVEVEVTLRPGQNIFTFVAAHEKARSEPVERRVIYRPPPGTPASTEKPDLILLAIGISDYSDPLLKLHYAEDDARAISAVLENQNGRLFSEVRTRILPAAGGRAGRAEIIDGLRWLRTQGTPRDVRIIFLSGHGGLDDRRNFYFYSQDQTSSEDPDLQSFRADRLLEDLVAAHSHAILMIDACHAGSVAAPPLARTDLTEVIKILRERFQLVTFAASTGTEFSVERPEWKHGAFTQALLEGLSGTADGFGGDKDGRIEVKELGAWVVDRVPKLTGGSQHALFDSGWVDASFPIFALDGVPQ